MDMVERVLLKWWAGKWNLKKGREGRKRIWRLMRKDPGLKKSPKGEAMLVVVNKRDSRISDFGKRIFQVMTRSTVGLMKGRQSLVITSRLTGRPCIWAMPVDVDVREWWKPRRGEGNVSWARFAVNQEQPLRWGDDRLLGTLGVYSVSMDLNVFSPRALGVIVCQWPREWATLLACSGVWKVWEKVQNQLPTDL